MTLILIILVLFQAVTLVLLYIIYTAFREAVNVKEELRKNELGQCKKIRELYISLKAEKEVTIDLENKIFFLIWKIEQNRNGDEIQ